MINSALGLLCIPIMQLYSWIISGLLASTSAAAAPETYDYVSFVSFVTFNTFTWALLMIIGK